MNIIVLAGGLSHERDVSLSSGGEIVSALESKGHRALLLDIYIGNASKTFEEAYRIQKETMTEQAYTVYEKEPDLKKLVQENGNQVDLVGKNVINLCKDADFSFLALHGGIGENGQLQALLDIYNIRYSGSGYKGSLLAMDKDISKKLMQLNGILTPKWIVVDQKEEVDFPMPCVVKPIDNGSSIGVEMVESKNQLMDALKNAEKYQSKVMIEQKIEGREFSVSLLGEEALPVIEIIPKQGFYDYESKYQVGATIEITPAEISLELSQKLSDIAKLVQKTLELSVYCRIDFIITENNEIYCIEANSLPGMTPTSLLPQEAAAAALSFPDLCEKIIRLSLKK